MEIPKKPDHEDPLLSDRAVFSEEAPQDLSENHDAHLYPSIDKQTIEELSDPG